MAARDEVAAPQSLASVAFDFPAPGGAGRGRSSERPCPEAEQRAGPTGPGGVGRGLEAERGPTQAAAAGSGPYGPSGGWRRKPDGWRRRGGGEGRGHESKTHFPGSAGKGTEHPLPGPAPNLRLALAGAVAAAGG